MSKQHTLSLIYQTSPRVVILAPEKFGIAVDLGMNTVFVFEETFDSESDAEDSLEGIEDRFGDGIKGTLHWGKVLLEKMG